MPVPSNPSERHQKGVGKLMEIMKNDGITILEAQYGHYESPPVLLNHRSDVFGVSATGTTYAVGEVEFDDDLPGSSTQQQLSAFASRAKSKHPAALLYLGVIAPPRTPPSTTASQLHTLAISSAMKQLREVGWQIYYV